MDFIRLPLQGASNVRDLGGICTRDNKITKFHTFIRGNKLSNLTEKDNELLKKYGITDIIDLRGKYSIQNNFISDDNINKKYFTLHHIPLSNKEIDDFINENLNSVNFDYGDGYILLLKNKEKIREIFKVLVNSDGGVLFHCTAGKDRTGVISALILSICGVDENDIIANYEVTYTYVQNEDFLEKYQKHFRYSKEQYMKTFLDKLKEKYGTSENYLLDCGITEEEINKLKNKFCKEINL